MQGGDKDRLILAAFVAGEPGAAEAFVRAHEASLYGFALRVLGDAAAAEDVVQETFLSAHQHGPSYEARGSVRAWLFTIARRACLRRRRLRVGEPSTLEPLDSLGAEAGWGSEDPESCFSRLQLREKLGAALERLSPSDREVIVLRDVEGLAGSEAAEVLGITLRALKSRLHRARLRLAAAYRKETSNDGD